MTLKFTGQTLSDLIRSIAVTAEAIYDAHDGLGHLFTLLPDLSLATRVRSRLTGYLFVEGPSIVIAVCNAVLTSEDVFAAEMALARSMRARLHRSFALRNLERLLLAAARRAGELALLDQGSAVQDALGLLARVERAYAEEQPGSYVRQCRLRPALHILERKKARAQKGLRAALARKAAAKDGQT
jgi:hypothetical protein